MTVQPHATWSVEHRPAVNTVASAQRAAAGAGARNVCTSLAVSLTGGAAAPAAVSVEVVIRDGAAGAGTIIWGNRLSLPAVAGEHDRITMDDLWIEGSPNTAMTAEFLAAPGANAFATAAMSGEVA
jgi:hypothetical protein